MNIIFLRHGEAEDNVKGLISDKIEYNSLLTENGINEVKESLELLPNNIEVMYVSPLPRTIETANIVSNKYPNIKVIIDDRIREINYGKYSHKKNNEELDEIRRKQINGDNLIRFGEYGENKLEIERRLTNFLTDVFNSKNNNILIVSHGSIISYIKRLLNIKSSHIKKGGVEIFKTKPMNLKKDF